MNLLALALLRCSRRSVLAVQAGANGARDRRRDRRRASRRPRRRRQAPGPALDPGDRQGDRERRPRRPGDPRDPAARPVPPRVHLPGDDQRLRARWHGAAGRSPPLQGQFEPMAMPPEADAAGGVDQRDIEGPLVDWRAKGHVVTLAGRETVDGKEAFKLEVKLKGGTTRYDYVDVATHQVVRSDVPRIVREPRDACSKTASRTSGRSAGSSSRTPSRPTSRTGRRFSGSPSRRSSSTRRSTRRVSGCRTRAARRGRVAPSGEPAPGPAGARA